MKSFEADSRMDVTTLITTIKALPPEITAFLLKPRHHNFTSTDLVNIIKVLPPHVTHVALCNFNLGVITTSALIESFRALPPQLTFLNLGTANLGVKPIEELIKIFEALPHSITSLVIKSNNFKSKLAQIFEVLSPNITKLEYEDLDSSESTSSIENFVQKLPLGINTLTLKGKLSYKNGADLVAIFKVTPLHVRSINLRGNDLGKISVAELTRALTAISAEVTSLDLSNNELQKTGVNLVTLLNNLPKSLTSLNLLDNNLSKNEETLAIILQAIPSNITSLQIEYLHSPKIFKAMPLGLRELDLRKMFIDEIGPSELALLWANIPAHISIIHFHLYHISSLSEAQLIALGNALPHVMELHVYEFESFNTGIEIVSHPSIDILKKHIGGAIKEAHLQLDDLELPLVLSNIILGKISGTDEDQINRVTSHLIPERNAIRMQGQAKREKELIGFDSQLSIVNDKANELKSRQYEAAGRAASELYLNLIKLRTQYYKGRIPYSTFKANAMAAMDASRAQLEIHRGWKELLANIALCIFSLLKYLFTGSFFKFNTDSQNKLVDLQKGLEKAMPVEDLRPIG